jgi:hypothetical protein
VGVDLLRGEREALAGAAGGEQPGDVQSACHAGWS